MNQQADRLREQAERARRLAGQVADEPTRQALNDTARDYLAEAERLEREHSDPSVVSTTPPAKPCSSDPQN
jgi:hypothetical protein